ncbi:MAG: SAM-dependent methyltransferase, partial [Actinomycetales bacterium]|nr:SAM-dependent methyltransferase [Actinomycetales bacterium]
MTGTTPSLTGLSPALAEAFRRHGYTVPGIEDALGSDAVDALGRSDAAFVRRSARGAGATGALLRLFVLGDALPRS